MIIFDLDGTFYPKNHWLTDVLRTTTKNWIKDSLNLSLEEVESIYLTLQKKYPNPYHGFQSLGLSPQDYLMNVFNVTNPSTYISEDKKLIKLFKNLPVSKHVATLSSEKYASQLIRSLGLESLITSVNSLINFGPSFEKISIYEELRSHESLKPSQILIVGDNYDVDLKDAEIQGYTICLVNNTPLRKSHSKYLSDLLVVNELTKG